MLDIETTINDDIIAGNQVFDVLIKLPGTTTGIKASNELIEDATANVPTSL